MIRCLISITYPNGRGLNVSYASGVDDSLSRVTNLQFNDDSNPAAAYTYFGLSSIASTSYPRNGNLAECLARHGATVGRGIDGRQ
jgi:hypothetical protein